MAQAISRGWRKKSVGEFSPAILNLKIFYHEPHEQNRTWRSPLRRVTHTTAIFVDARETQTRRGSAGTPRLKKRKRIQSKISCLSCVNPLSRGAFVVIVFLHWLNSELLPSLNLPYKKILIFGIISGMWNSISGVITEKHADSVCIESAGGLEWAVAMPESDIRELADKGKTARIFTWLYHKEDAMRLIGFSDAVRRDTFLALISVDGIGIKGALKIMGGITQSELEHALESEDLTRLSAIPGLGKKTAAKMILALKGKLVSVDSNFNALEKSPYAELADALSGMGYDKRSALDALSKAAVELEKISGTEKLDAKTKEEEVFKKAVLILSGG
jgi:Holliday junction DNA helicase RuvA